MPAAQNRQPETDYRHLQALLFLKQIGSPLSQRALHLVHVEPVSHSSGSAIVHFAYKPQDWAKAGHMSDLGTVIEQLKLWTADSPFSSFQLAFKHHDYAADGWPIGWAETSRMVFDDVPWLVAERHPDGSITGAVMREDAFEKTSVRFADTYVEPGAVRSLITSLRSIAPGERFLQWHKECNTSGDSLEAAIAKTPLNVDGMRVVLLYDGIEWLCGVSTSVLGHTVVPLDFMSMADFHRTRVSARKRALRKDIDWATQHQTVAGSTSALLQALEDLGTCCSPKLATGPDCPAIASLSRWWNSTAPAGMRDAGMFHVHVWDPTKRIFISGDPRKPAMLADAFPNIPSYAVFDVDGLPPVAITFFRGRQHNTGDAKGDTRTYYASGDLAGTNGLPPEEFDDSHVAISGLRMLQSLRATALDDLAA